MIQAGELFFHCGHIRKGMHWSQLGNPRVFKTADLDAETIRGLRIDAEVISIEYVAECSNCFRGPNDHRPLHKKTRAVGRWAGESPLVEADVKVEPSGPSEADRRALAAAEEKRARRAAKRKAVLQ